MEQRIPKIIHYCWFGGGEMPLQNLKCIDSWKKYCPDYEIRRWDESNYDISKCAYVKQAYAWKKWGFVSDYARLDILYQYGGIYLDTDVELIKNMNALLCEEAFMGFERIDAVNTGLGFGACKGNIHLKNLCEKYEKMEFVNSDGSINLIPTPLHVTEYLVEVGLKLNGNEQRLEHLLILPITALCPKDYETGKLIITNGTYSIHHFAASWVNADERRLQRVKWVLYKFFPDVLVEKLYYFIHRIWYGVKLLLHGKISDFFSILRNRKRK